MMLIYLSSLLLILSNAFAGAGPELPKGWVEVKSETPILLTWEKSLGTKKQRFSVQKFPRNERFEKFVKEAPLDKDSCRELQDGGWNQTWCLRNKNILVLLSQEEDATVKNIKNQLRAWILTQE